MANRSGANSIPYWGVYATATGATGLPNVAGGTFQNGNVEAGDIAFVSGTALLYVCTTATPGAAVWSPVQPGTGFANTATAGPASAAGAATTALRSDATIPLSFVGDVQGDLAVRGAAAYQRLAAVAAGYVLQSAGVGQLPVWGLPGPTIATPQNLNASFSMTTVTSPTVISDPSAGNISVSGADSLTVDIYFNLIKTNAATTNKITVVCPVGWKINLGTVSTNFDLPLSATTGTQAFYTIHTDIANLRIWAHPNQGNSTNWGWG
jgi:hypothetical protein